MSLMRPLKGFILTVLFAVAFGFGGYFIGTSSTEEQNEAVTDWQELLSSYPDGRDRVRYNSTAIFAVDIPLPEIRSVAGRSKFLESLDDVSSVFRFGYVVSIDIDSLDITKVPDQYAVPRESAIGTVPPVEEVLYEVEFTFDLLDEDGFRLVELTSAPHNVRSGQINEFQDTVNFRTQ